MKNRLCFFVVLLACGSVARAAENPYDVLGKTIAPFLQVFAKDASNHALSAEFSLVEMTGLSSEFAGAKASLQMETPDKIRLSSALLGVPASVCRNADEIWITPGVQLDALIRSRGELPKLDAKEKLGRIELPIPAQQLVLLPALLQVRDIGEAAVNGVNCRVLDVTLMPELAKSLKVGQWAMRAWVRPDYTLARMTLAKQHWHLAVDFEKTEYAPRLPAATWQPSPEQASDVLHLDAPRFKQLLEAAARAFKLPG